MSTVRREWDWDNLAAEASSVVALRSGSALYEALAIGARAMFLGFALPAMAPGRVLEVGCGKGQWLALMRERRISTAGGDRSFPMLRQAHGVSDVAQFDARRLPFGDRAFENVLTVTVLQHLTEPLGAIAELARVARQRIVIQEMTGNPVPRRFTPDTFARPVSWYERVFDEHGWRLRATRQTPRPGVSLLSKAIPRDRAALAALPRAVGLALVTHTWLVFEPNASEARRA